MTRLEENRMVVKKMTELSELNPSGTYEAMMTFQIGAIATMLADISKSLAIIANKAENEPQESEDKMFETLYKYKVEMEK